VFEEPYDLKFNQKCTLCPAILGLEDSILFREGYFKNEERVPY
jgi:hypothetical protein